MTAELLDEVTLRMPLSRGWTWDELQRLPEHDGHRYEIIDGSLYVSPSPSRPHQIAVGRIVRLLAGGVAYREVTTVAAGSVAVVATPFRVELRPAELAGPRRRV